MPAFNVTRNSTMVTITTDSVQLQYVVGQPLNHTGAVRVLGLDPSGTGFREWNASMTNNNSRNLLGTIRSLDQEGVISLNCTEVANVFVHDESLHCAWALMSRSGFAIVNDTYNWALTAGAAWWDSPNVDLHDWYLFAHGLDYKAALRDYTLVGGKIALPPRFATGVWWSRWYNYNNLQSRKILEDYESRDIPLDVLIWDMNWYSIDRALWHLAHAPASSLVSAHGNGCLPGIRRTLGQRTRLMAGPRCRCCSVDWPCYQSDVGPLPLCIR